MAYEPLHHKYRPQTFAHLVGQTAIAATLSNAIAQERIAPAYLFTGPRGTGKTSSARILAKSLNCIAVEHPTASPCGECETCRSITNGSALDVIEIDAASNTGVDNIREIIERAQFAPVQCRFKVYVIDECHMLSTAAFNALLKTLEEPPERVVFVLATTDPQRVLPTIISRCQRFDYRRIALDGMVAHLRYIADRESINIDQSALTLVAQISNGGLRDAESLLDQLSLLPDLITPDKVWDLVGAVPEQDLLMLLTAIASNDSETLLGTCRQILDRGREPLVVLQNLAAFYLNLLIAQTAPQRSDLVAVTTETWQELCRLAPQWQTGVILQGQQKLKESEFQIRNTTQPRLWLEVTLLGLLPSACATPVPINSGNSSGVNPSIAPPPKPSNLLTFPGSNHLTVVDNPIPQREAESDQKINQVSSEQNFVEEIIEENIATFAPLNINLEQTWAEALNKLGALSQSLFKTYGSLLNLGPGSATVSVTTQQLLNIAAGKKGELETALGQACGHAVKVNLVVAKQSPTGKLESPTPTSPAIHSRPPAIPTDQNNQTNRPPDSINQIPQTRPEPPKPTPVVPPSPSPQAIAHSAANSEIKPSPRRETSPGSKSKPQLKRSPGPEENLLEEIPEGETRKAIEQFAKNFSGQIVASELEPQDSAPDLDQEKELVNPSQSSPPEETSHPIILNRPAIELDDEEDLPF